jgi:hypothetical protein
MKPQGAGSSSIMVNQPAINTVTKVYPNPSNGIFHINFVNNRDGKKEIEVFDMDGKIIMNMNVNNANFFDLNLTNQPTGTYIIKAVNNARVVYQGKLVKLQ